MNAKFRELVETLDPKWQELLTSTPVVAEEISASKTPSVAYIFFRSGRNCHCNACPAGIDGL
jgi:hypothetical protein